MSTPTPPQPNNTYTFDPSDVSSVGVTDPNGFFVSGVPPWYCATMSGALKLQTYLTSKGITTKIYMDYPMPNWNTEYFNVPKVPWLDDGKGAKENAGGLIWNYKVLPYFLADKTVLEAFPLDDAASQQNN